MAHVANRDVKRCHCFAHLAVVKLSFRVWKITLNVRVLYPAVLQQKFNKGNGFVSISDAIWVKIDHLPQLTKLVNSTFFIVI